MGARRPYRHKAGKKPEYKGADLSVSGESSDAGERGTCEG